MTSNFNFEETKLYLLVVSHFLSKIFPEKKFLMNIADLYNYRRY